jgi:GH3 auxin-responsive promoter
MFITAAVIFSFILTFVQLVFALLIPNISFYAVIFAPGLIHTIKMIENQFEEMSLCIASANFNNSTLVRSNIVNTKFVSTLNRALEESAVEYGGQSYRLKRAEDIRKQCQHQHIPGILYRLWPSLSFVSTTIGGSFSIYKQEIEFYCGEKIPLINQPLYVASEGLLGTIASVHTDEYFLAPTSVFYEFIREEDAHQVCSFLRNHGPFHTYEYRRVLFCEKGFHM